MVDGTIEGVGEEEEVRDPEQDEYERHRLFDFVRQWNEVRHAELVVLMLFVVVVVVCGLIVLSRYVQVWFLWRC